jgi:hypothetical protein
MPIARASMLLRIVFPKEDNDIVTREVTKLGGVITARNSTTADAKEGFMDVKLDPEFYRKMEDLIKTVGSGKSRLEVLQMRMASANTGDVSSSAAAAESKDHFDGDSDEEEEGEEDNTTKNKKNKKSTSAISKKDVPKRKDDLQALLNEVTGMNDIADEELPDEYAIVETLVVSCL